MPLVRMTHRMENIEKFRSPGKNSSIMVVKCTCGRGRGGDMAGFAYIYEEYKRRYTGRGASAHTEASRSTVVCLKEGCSGMRRVAYDPKTYKLPMLTWAEYQGIKAKQAEKSTSTIRLGNSPDLLA